MSASVGVDERCLCVDVEKDEAKVVLVEVDGECLCVDVEEGEADVGLRGVVCL